MSYSIINEHDRSKLETLRDGFVVYATDVYPDVLERSGRDWMHSFFYRFKEDHRLEDYSLFSDYVTGLYFDEKYDVHTSNYGSEKSELRLIRETLMILNEYKHQLESHYEDTTESDYMVYKFVMLNIMSREKELKAYVIAECTSSEDEKLQDMLTFFDVLERHVQGITMSAFNQFKTVPLMKEFVSNMAMIYSKIPI